MTYVLGDPENCLQLQDASGSTDLTGLVTEAIPSDSGYIRERERERGLACLCQSLIFIIPPLIFSM